MPQRVEGHILWPCPAVWLVWLVDLHPCSNVAGSFPGEGATTLNVYLTQSGFSLKLLLRPAGFLFEGDSPPTPALSDRVLDRNLRSCTLAVCSKSGSLNS